MELSDEELIERADAEAQMTFDHFSDRSNRMPFAWGYRTGYLAAWSERDERVEKLSAELSSARRALRLAWGYVCDVSAPMSDETWESIKAEAAEEEET